MGTLLLRLIFGLVCGVPTDLLVGRGAHSGAAGLLADVSDRVLRGQGQGTQKICLQGACMSGHLGG